MRTSAQPLRQPIGQHPRCARNQLDIAWKRQRLDSYALPVGRQDVRSGEGPLEGEAVEAVHDEAAEAAVAQRLTHLWPSVESANREAKRVIFWQRTSRARKAREERFALRRVAIV
jgi:hypothetical protein